jgi:hypothetical protein
MISIYKEECDPEGRTVVEISMNGKLFGIMAIVGPLALMGATYYFVGRGPIGMPWFMVAGPIVIGALGYAMVTWMGKASRVRVTIDRAAGKLLVATSAGQSEVRIADLAGAAFGTNSDSDGSPVYRLEFVMKNGEPVPATSAYFSAYGPDDRAKMAAAINNSLGKPLV